MTNLPDFLAPEWVKSSYSNTDGGDCVEWSPRAAAISGTVPVRDSKTPGGPVLGLGADAWTSFVSAVRNGQIRN